MLKVDDRVAYAGRCGTVTGVLDFGEYVTVKWDHASSLETMASSGLRRLDSVSFPVKAGERYSLTVEGSVTAKQPERGNVRAGDWVRDGEGREWRANHVDPVGKERRMASDNGTPLGVRCDYVAFLTVVRRPLRVGDAIENVSDSGAVLPCAGRAGQSDVDLAARRAAPYHANYWRHAGGIPIDHDQTLAEQKPKGVTVNRAEIPGVTTGTLNGHQTAMFDGPSTVTYARPNTTGCADAVVAKGYAGVAAFDPNQGALQGMWREVPWTKPRSPKAHLTEVVKAAVLKTLASEGAVGIRHEVEVTTKRPGTVGVNVELDVPVSEVRRRWSEDDRVIAFVSRVSDWDIRREVKTPKPHEVGFRHPTTTIVRDMIRCVDDERYARAEEIAWQRDEGGWRTEYEGRAGR